MNNTPITPLGDTDLQKDALSTALRNKRLNTSNKKRLVEPSGPDDNPGDPAQEPVT